MKSTILTFLFILQLSMQTAYAGFRVDTNVPAGSFSSENAPGNDSIVHSDTGKVSFIYKNTWVAYENFDFGTGTMHFGIEAASAHAGGFLQKL